MANPTTELVHLSAVEAWDFLQKNSNAKLIDIRATTEYLFIGHPKDCIHLAWMDDPDWDISPTFVEDIQAEQKDNCPIVMLCRSGNRSEKAGDQLIAAGLTNIYHITDGFEGELDEQHHRNSVDGWRFSGLPWEQA